jgi:hypothetical protein
VDQRLAALFERAKDGRLETHDHNDDGEAPF